MQLFCVFGLHSGFSLSQSTAAPLLEESRGSWETWALSLVLLLSLTKADTEPLVLVGRTENSSTSYFCAFPHSCPVHSHLSSFCALSDRSAELNSAARPLKHWFLHQLTSSAAHTHLELLPCALSL